MCHQRCNVCMSVCVYKVCVGLADGSRSSIVLMDVDTDDADALLVSRGQRQDEDDDDVVVVDEWQMVVDDGWNVGGLLAYLLMMTIRSTRWLPNKN